MTATAIASENGRTLWSATGTLERIQLGSLVVAIAGATAFLLPFWRESPELSHGYFAPLCAVALLWQSRRERNAIDRWSGMAATGSGIAVALGGLLVATIAAMAALAQGPFHSQTGFLVGIAMSAFTWTTLVALAGAPGDTARVNGAGLCAGLLWWFAVPLPSGTLSRFTLYLQDIITAGSVHAVHLFGLPATRDGNIIRLANTLVGVEEACSGIRSLTACLFAGVVLGGLMLEGVLRRIVLILGAGVLAVAANYVRSISLCLMAAHGIEIRGFWHDATAYAVLGATALALFAGCLVFAPRHPADAPARVPRARRTFVGWVSGTHLVFAAVVAVLVIAVTIKTTSKGGTSRPVPDLAALTVMETPEWNRRTDESIFAFSDALNTTHLRQESYFRGDVQLTFYVAYWPAEQSTLGSVALHAPSICLPGSGWNTLSVPPSLASYPLKNPRRFSFEKMGYPQHVWFWHFYDGQPVTEPAGLYPWQLVPLLLQPAVRARAPQWVVRISSNKPLESLVDEPIVRDFLARVRAAGLASAPSS